MRISLIAAALVAAGMTPLAPVQAEPSASPSLAVRVVDLDLSTPAGVRQLDLRLARAASAVCEVDSPATLAANLRRWACEKAAIEGAAPRRAALIAAARRAAPALASRN